MRSLFGVVALGLVVSLLLSAAAEAQRGESRAGVEGIRAGRFASEVRTVYRGEDGLPDDDVFSVAVAADGSVYAATAGGLGRFGGGRWSKVAGVAGMPRLVASHGAEILAVTDEGLYRVGAKTSERLAPLPAELNGGGAVRSVAGGKSVLLGTGAGLFRLADGRIVAADGLNRLLGENRDVRQVAVAGDGRVAVAAMGGLFVRDSAGPWKAMYPRSGNRSWAPYDVRGVGFDRTDRLWFASVQGAGCEDGKGWTLYTGHDGLPYNDFTTVAAGEEGVIWFGTHIGAIRFDGDHWAYRQGRRWLPDDDVRAVAVTDSGDAWLATARGVGVIERRPMTLAKKAKLFNDAIDKYHRRTPYGYVLYATLASPGDTSEWANHDSDNDGLWTGMYGAAECFRYAATGQPQAKARATKAFEALRFLSQVTQGGSHPTQPGFPARSILPTSGPDPNEHANAERDRERQKRDPQWKVIEPRWPISEDGKWYWKTDTSSDELDGHYFFYAQYFDLVAETEEEKAAVREVCLAITDHLLHNDFNLIDHDGRPTRWAHFGPQVLNHETWSGGRGLNSLSILSYLKTAEHMSGDAKYRDAYEMLIRKHGYDINVLVPKYQSGPGTGNQSDDEMAFMCYYNLLKYEKEPDLRRKYLRSLVGYWSLERMELCPLFNYIFAACMEDVETRWTGQLVSAEMLEEALEALKRFPLDRLDWGLKNSHRTDIVRLPSSLWRRRGDRGHRVNGKALPIDERQVTHWNHDPWRLDYGGNGTHLADGAAFLLPYYMGLYHGFIVER